jgi:hypothetical protein
VQNADRSYRDGGPTAGEEKDFELAVKLASRAADVDAELCRSGVLL